MVYLLKTFPALTFFFFCIVLLYIKSTVSFIKMKACKFPRNTIYNTICLVFYWFTHNVDSLLKNATRFRHTEFVKPLENVNGLAFNILKKSRMILFSFSLLILSCFIIESEEVEDSKLQSDKAAKESKLTKGRTQTHAKINSFSDCRAACTFCFLFCFGRFFFLPFF